MTTFEEALGVILAQVAPLPATQVSISDAPGYVLAQPVHAEVDSPRFQNSAVDGFAVRAEEVMQPPVALTIQAEVQAGSLHPAALQQRSAIRIFTGAPVPEGADAVVMQEDCRWSSDRVTILVPPKAGQHVRGKGEDFETGQLLFEAGTIVTPAAAGVLVMNGLASCQVYKRPSVAVIPTGNELTTLGEPLRAGHIYDSNGPALHAAVTLLGCECTLCPPARDDLDGIGAALGKAFAEHDVVITCGGVSVGAYDHVSEACARVGVEMEVAGVAIRPGKPFHFGRTGKKLFFGLPGNPVSALVTFTLFAKPALLKLSGAELSSGRLTAKLGTRLENTSDRDEFVPAILNGSQAEPFDKRGSHLMGGLSKANCLIHLPARTGVVESGAGVNVLRLWV